MTKVSSSSRIRFGVFVLCVLALVATLGGCGKGEGNKPGATGASSGKAEEKNAPFALLTAAHATRNGRSAIALTFSAPLAAEQSFDKLVAVTGPEGETVEGSWVLRDDRKELQFPFVTGNKTYAVTVQGGLLAADGRSLGEEVKRDIASGSLPAAVGFASTGSVLPARGTRGLPVVSVNVQDADIEFFKIHDEQLSSLFCAFPNNKHRDNYQLDHEERSWDTCDHERMNLSLPDMGDSVYANHYTLEGAADARSVNYIPVQDIPQLAEPGVYMAVMKKAGRFTGGYDTTIFFVSDLGLHLRVYQDNALLHVASLQDGKPVAGAAIEIDDESGVSKLKATTDKDGNALITYKVQPTDILIARHDKDVSVLPFNRPALDVSNFDISGRRQKPVEIFAWSGRDLYRPGETLRASALMRDYDGKPLPAQPLFVSLKQPDGRSVANTKLAPKDLNEFELSQVIPADAPTGLWQLEFRLDPASKEALQVFPFHVEEFLPERLKVELSSPQEQIAPDEPLKLVVQSSYLYGSPADGNRFTAKLLVKPQVHPIAALPDTFFGNPLIRISKQADDILDTKLDEKGHLEEDIGLPAEVTPVAPMDVVLSGSVYETGGRTVTRILNKTYWPAPELVGVRPLFDPKQGAQSEGRAGFEILRADASGKLLAGSHLKVRLQREARDFYWLYEHGDEWKSNDNVSLQLIEERDIDVAAGQRFKLDFPVEWGGYRVEVFDPQTQLTTVFPFFAGYSWEDENLGKEARPDKVKLALDKGRYRAGDTLKVTVTPPQAGPGLLLVETDHLLYSKSVDFKAGDTFEIPVTQDWEREDVSVVALVLRGGSATDKTTPARAMGIEHVTMDREDRRLPITLTAPAMMRPGNPLEVTVQAEGLAGQQAHVTLSAVDEGVLNITNYPVPDGWAWMFAKRAMGIDAYDLYSRVIEAMDGTKAKVRYGGDLSGQGAAPCQAP